MKVLNKKAISIIEYTALLIIIIGAFLVMSKYIQRGIFGNWAQTGKSFAFGRQYDPQKSIDCAFDEQSNLWYDYNCYEYQINKEKCNGDTSCEESVITSSLCRASSCQQANNGEVL